MVRNLKAPQEEPRCRWKDNIGMDLREIGWKLRTGGICLGVESSGGLL
jgi:hypothetical protein